MKKIKEIIKELFSSIIIALVLIGTFSFFAVSIIHRNAAGKNLTLEEMFSWPHIQDTLVIFIIIAIIYFVISKAYKQGKVNDKRDFEEREK